MKIVLVWNSLSHLMLPLCEALIHRGEDVSFISLEPLGSERTKLGFADLNHSVPFVVNAYEGREESKKAAELCSSCDILILNGRRTHFRWRTKPSCIVFVFSERIFKDPTFSRRNILRYCKYFPTWFYTANANLLCASAYAKRDYQLLGQYIGHAYKWGYFTEVKPQDPEALMGGKDPLSIVWAGRLIPWKHPEIAIAMAERLMKDGIPFSLSLIGEGVMRQELEETVRQKRLSSSVHVLGPMPPEQVRAHMERATVYLFTSDRGEGWGAVLNECMNSSCIVIADSEIGSVPYLIQDGINGFIYDHRDLDSMYRRLKDILTDPAAYLHVALAANDTMQSTWNPETAADRLLKLAEALTNGQATPFEDGPCSRA